MPKKSDRANHGTAMSELFPDVSLEESSSEESEASAEESDARAGASSEDDSSKELKNFSSTALQNQQAPAKAPSPAEDEEGSNTPTGESAPARDAGASPAELDDPEEPLSVHPRQRPHLGQKLGPYVSDDVDRALEEVYLTFRRRFGGEASKSLIVEAALRYVLSDCLVRGVDSELTRWFERVLDDERVLDEP